MLRQIFILILLFISIIGFEGAYSQEDQSVIKGQVIDSNDIPLPGISVIVEDTGVGVATDLDGKFKLSINGEGYFTLSISGLGYRAEIQEVTVQLHQQVYLEIQLFEEVSEMEELLIVGESEFTSLKKLGFEIETIETKSIQGQTIELNTILSQVPGIQVRQQGGFGSRSSYIINGLEGNAIRFFLDGVPMDYFGSSFSVNSIPVSLIRRIDVYKGVVPVELGNDALGGAINLVTNQYSKNAADISYSYGSFNTHRVSLQGNLRDKNSGTTFKLSSFYNYSDNNYKVWGNDIFITDPETFQIHRGIKVRRFHDAFQSKAIKADVGFTDKSWADQLFVGVMLSDLDKEIQHGPTMIIPFGESTYSQQVIMPNITYQKSDFLIDGFQTNIFSAYSHLNRSRVDTSRSIYNWYGEIDGQRTLGGEQTRTLNSLVEKVFINRINLSYQLNDVFKIGFNQLLNYLERTENDPLVTQKNEGYWAPQQYNKQSLGLVLQSTSLNERLNSSAFFKWHSYTANIKTSNTEAGVVNYNTVATNSSNPGYGWASSYKLFEFIKLNGSIEQAIRLPEPHEILGDGLLVSSTVVLRSESSLNINLGLDYDILDDAKHSLSFTGNFFYRNVTDLIQPYQYEPGAFVNINFDKVTMKGFDGKIDYSLGERFNFAYTISYLQPIVKSDQDELGNRNLTYNTRLPNTPFFQTGFQTRCNLTPWFNMNAGFFVHYDMNYIASFYRNSEAIGKFNKDKIPAQFVVNGGFGYSWPANRLIIAVDFKNIFNEQVYDNFAVQKPGRAVYLKGTFRIFNS